MKSNSFSTFIGSAIVLTLFTLLTVSILQWLDLGVGSFIDWIVGIASFWWLLVIVTFPWNIHFQAREVVFEAAKSVEKEIPVQEQQVAYAKQWVKWSLVIAISLHLISAIGLYALAFMEISTIGYISSGAALLLTGLRPIVRAYEYISSRLSAIKGEIRYPREDVFKLRSDVKKLEQNVKSLQAKFKLDDKDSWAAKQQATFNEINQALETIHIDLKELHLNNQSDHKRLSREAEQAIAQISADGQFLDHVREIIRFIKKA